MNYENIEGTSADQPNTVEAPDLMTIPVSEVSDLRDKAVRLSVVEKERDNVRADLAIVRGNVAARENEIKEVFRLIGEAAQEHLGHYTGYKEFFDAVNGTFPTTRLDELFVEYFGIPRDIDVDIEYEVTISGTVWEQGQSFDISGSLDNVTIQATLSDVPASVDVSDIDDPSEYGGPESTFSSDEGDLTVEFELVGIGESY